MSEEKFHFEIPQNNIRTVKYDKQGFAPSVQRISHSDHGQKLKAQTQDFINTEFQIKDIEYTSDLFLQIETPEKITIKSQKLKIQVLNYYHSQLKMNQQELQKLVRKNQMNLDKDQRIIFQAFHLKTKQTRQSTTNLMKELKLLLIFIML